MDEAIIGARNVEDVGKPRALERKTFGEKRKFAGGGSGSHKKGNSNSNQSKQGSVIKCDKCGWHHPIECRTGSAACYNCGKFGHKMKDYKTKNANEVEWYSCHEKEHLVSIVLRKAVKCSCLRLKRIQNHKR